MGKRPTIQMVAERAGVSRGTVDRVINNRSYVRAEVRQRVLAAMQELGYLSPAARAAAQPVEQTFQPVKLGVILPNSFDHHFRTEIMRGVDAAREELAECTGAIRKLGLKLEDVKEFSMDGVSHSLILLKKIAPTPGQYPRRYAKIKQNPL